MTLPEKFKHGKWLSGNLNEPALMRNYNLEKFCRSGGMRVYTDVGYFYDGVPTVSKPPLTLGHEISGVWRVMINCWVKK